MDPHRRLYVGLPLRRGGLSILTLLLALPCLGKISQAQNTPSTTVPATYFGMSFNKPVNSPLSPVVTFGMVRIWDSSNSQWPAIQSAAGPDSGSTAQNYNWSSLESLLQNAYNDGATTAVYTMSRTPQWALDMWGGTTCSTTNNNLNQPACDDSCNEIPQGDGYSGTGAAAPGQCYPPSDLNPDGTGTDQTWINWVTALANEASKLCNEGGYACIQYFEIWNEVDRNNQAQYWFKNQPTYNAPFMFPNSGTKGQGSGNSYYGSYAQLVRMTQDADCILLGRASLRTVSGHAYAIDNGGSGGAGTYGTCTNINGLAPAGSQVLTPSSHPQAPEGLHTTQNFLYCSYGSPSSGYPNYCNTGDDEAYSVNIINMHMKPGNETNGWYEETQMLSEYCGVEGGCDGDTAILQSREKGFPFWNDESGYAGAQGDAWGGAGGALSLAKNPDMQASFIARYALTQWSLGITNYDWYDYDLSNEINGGSYNGTGAQAGDPALAESTIAYWMIGQTMTVGGTATSCSVTLDAAGNKDPNGNPTLWTCPLQGPDSFAGTVIWDSYVGSGSGGYSCASDSTEGDDCTYESYTIPSGIHKYRDLWGNETNVTAGTAYNIVSNLPILLENKSLSN